MSEKSRRDSIVKRLNKRPFCFAHVQAVRGRRGPSDIAGCENGRAFQFEVKLEGARYDKTREPLQEKWLRDWAQAGALTGFISTYDEAAAILDGKQPPNTSRRTLERILA